MNTEQKKYTIKEIEKCNDEEKNHNGIIFFGGVMALVGIFGIVVDSTIDISMCTAFAFSGSTIFVSAIAGKNTTVSKRELLEYQLKINELEEYDNQEGNERIWVKTKSEYRR